MGLDHPDHIFGTILDVYAAAGSTRTNDFIDNSRPCDHNRKLCGSSHITPKFVTQLICDNHNVSLLKYVFDNTYANHCKSNIKAFKTSDGIIDSAAHLLTDFNAHNRALLRQLLWPF